MIPILMERGKLATGTHQTYPSAATFHHIDSLTTNGLYRFHLPELIDKDTPDDVKKITGMNGDDLELVFSDEFETDGRSFYPGKIHHSLFICLLLILILVLGDDPWWEAVDLWYGVTGDLEWYDPSQVTTKDGSLIITMDSVTSTTRTVPESTAPFTIEENHKLEYRSGMLQSWNKMCFTSGYIEVAIILPGADETNQGYVRGTSTTFDNPLAYARCSGQVLGLWLILADLDIRELQMECGRTRKPLPMSSAR